MVLKSTIVWTSDKSRGGQDITRTLANNTDVSLNRLLVMVRLKFLCFAFFLKDESSFAIRWLVWLLGEQI
jgi:hypothetical protein